VGFIDPSTQSMVNQDSWLSLSSKLQMLGIYIYIYIYSYIYYNICYRCSRALPCWDEPDMKAKFECSLYAPIDRVAVSNTPVTETTCRVNSLGESERLWKFGETPIMSTYLLAFVVGEFDTVSGYNGCGTQVTVYTPVGKSAQGNNFFPESIFLCQGGREHPIKLKLSINLHF
jgi:hypothetical protein